MKMIAEIYPGGIFCTLKHESRSYGNSKFIGLVKGKPSEIMAIGDRWFIQISDNGRYAGSLWADVIQRGE